MFSLHLFDPTSKFLSRFRNLAGATQRIKIDKIESQVAPAEEAAGGQLILASSVDTCSLFKPCRNGAICHDLPGNNYLSTCKGGFTGSQCEVNINDCSLTPCFNNATHT